MVSHSIIYTIMKLLSFLSLLVSSLFFFGCATTSESGTEEEAASEETADAASGKTAYEGSTGAGLLMERYKSGQIEGYRD